MRDVAQPYASRLVILLAKRNGCLDIGAAHRSFDVNKRRMEIAWTCARPIRRQHYLRPLAQLFAESHRIANIAPGWIARKPIRLPLGRDRVACADRDLRAFVAAAARC